MIYDSFADSVSKNAPKALYLFSPVLIIFALYYGLMTMPCYKEQRGLILLLINYVHASTTWNLMIHNMTKQPFTVL